jgi:hypothetical protein
MIKKLLTEALKQKKIISITTKDIEWDQSVIGYITEINDSYFTINEIDEYGTFIGNMIYEINNVLCVQVDDWYLRNMQIIHGNVSMFNPNLRVSVYKKGKELITHFKYLKKNKKITTFFSLKITL